MNDKIKKLREQIDETDEKISLLLKERFSLVKKIGEEKKTFSLPLTDGKREDNVIENFLKPFEEDEKIQAKDVISSIIKSSKNLEK